MRFYHSFFMLIIALFLCCCTDSHITAQSTPPQYQASNGDIEAIRQTALDYAEGWYEGDTARMERCLSPNVVIRSIKDNRLVSVTADEMISSTKKGAGMGYVGKKDFVVEIVDIHNNIAEVKVESPQYIDYLQIGKINNHWLIFNVFWTEK